jgi:hypothetical protein
MDAEHHPDEPLVDPTQPMRDQSIQMLMLVEDRFPDVLTYRYPLDMSSPESVDNVREELGPDTRWPSDPNGYYYFVYLTDRNKKQVPVFLPEGEVRTAMFILAASLDAAWAATVAFYDWLLP